ncbi:MAG: SPOR domain-containing protein [Ruminococcus sp.]|uniref:SPOR domain-containing protein n=1 Tax=Ruminococcus sp. TaxID=41978 RepID=UPI0028732250|nr:SPOR domain-containing protein [Ruminococcus sp.]MBQ3285486.1 SPOR domain-containing protein [Ruminococcus sp.]
MKRFFALILSLLSVSVFCSCSFINNNYYVQNDSAVSSESVAESKPVEKEPVASSAQENNNSQSSSKTDVSTFHENTPFYGIWVSASKSYDDAAAFSDEVSSKGFSGFVEVTTDWNNLNNEKWYVVTAGKYASEDEATNKLDEVKKYYPDAYVKYSGEYHNSSSYHPSFYGIWVSASKNYDDAAAFSDEVSSKGFSGIVEVTTDWSNLNSEKWYVVTAGKYTSEDEATNKLDEVKKYYPDAYVKYSGEYLND